MLKSDNVLKQLTTVYYLVFLSILVVSLSTQSSFFLKANNILLEFKSNAE